MSGFKHAWSGLLLAALLTAALATRADSTDVNVEQRWDVHPNGDVTDTTTAKFPVILYGHAKSKEQQLVTMFRNLAAEGSTVEVASKKADWDDVNQTLTLTVTFSGFCQNLGDHWEVKVPPGAEFSNLDETRKIAYFHATSKGDLGQQILIQGKLCLPADCTRPSWDSNRRMIVYCLPAPAAVVGGGFAGLGLWWSMSAACLVAGVVLWIVSLLVKSPARAGQAPV